MRIRIFVALLLVASAAAAQTLAPVVVAPTPVTTAAVVEAAWWSGLADQAITAVAYTLTVMVPVVGAFLAKLLWSRSKLAAMLFSQAMLDKLNAGIIAFIRAEAEKLHEKFGAEPTEKVKESIVKAAQPKIEEAFKESLRHFDKSGGQVTDMIRARMETALRPEIPGVMKRS